MHVLSFALSVVEGVAEGPPIRGHGSPMALTLPGRAGMNPRAERTKPLRGWILARRASFFQP